MKKKIYLKYTGCCSRSFSSSINWVIETLWNRDRSEVEVIKSNSFCGFVILEINSTREPISYPYFIIPITESELEHVERTRHLPFACDRCIEVINHKNESVGGI